MKNGNYSLMVLKAFMEKGYNFFNQGDVIPMTYCLSFDCTNNMVEYEALILGLKAAILLKV